jgi:DnaK suppressor protein
MGMNEKKLDHFKKLLLDAKSQIMNRGLLNSSEDFHISQDDLADESDLATNIISQQISFSMREKEQAKLNKINHALEKINDGTYGLCEDCDEPIGEKRLQHQPWAELCIIHAEEHERAGARRFKGI